MIFEMVRGDIENGKTEKICEIASNNGKNACKRFIREHCLSIGFYEIHKTKGVYILSSSYGIYVMAMKKKGEN